MYGKSFECFYNIFLFYERHFAIDLSKFGLAVCPEVFVAETFYYLEVTVEARDHQQLLECLGTLWQSVKLSGVHT